MDTFCKIENIIYNLFVFELCLTAAFRVQVNYNRTSHTLLAK